MYISSNANRFYAGIETSYGQAATIGAANRFPAVRLQAQQSVEAGKRLDKTGTRTFQGAPTTGRRNTGFEARTYLTSWTGIGQPSYGPLFQAALGQAPVISTGLTVASVQSGTEIQTTAAHNLAVGSACAYQGEIRFVTSVLDASTFVINAPFANAPTVNVALAPTITYRVSSALPSLTLYDYWDPATAVSRVITGATVDTMQFAVNGDYHEFLFNGPACDLLDSSSFVAGSGGLAAFPAEPALAAFDYSIVPGHLGQAWLGNAASQFFTLTEAAIAVRNHVELRNTEFGSSYPRSIAPGMREVISRFSLFAQDDQQTASLYAAAKQRVPAPAMLQLGQQQGQLMGIYMPAVTLEVPNYNDAETRLQWDFKNNLAQGTVDNEIFLAFA